MFVNLLIHWLRRKANQDADQDPPEAKQPQPPSREDDQEHPPRRKESPGKDR